MEQSKQRNEKYFPHGRMNSNELKQQQPGKKMTEGFLLELLKLPQVISSLVSPSYPKSNNIFSSYKFQISIILTMHNTKASRNIARVEGTEHCRLLAELQVKTGADEKVGAERFAYVKF